MGIKVNELDPSLATLCFTAYSSSLGAFVFVF